MQLPNPTTVAAISTLVNGKIDGDGLVVITAINEVHRTSIGDLTFVDHKKFHRICVASDCSAIITNEKIATEKPQIIVDNPFSAFCFLLEKLGQKTKPEVEAVNGSFIDKSAKVGESTIIHPGCYIGANVVIGEQCIIYPNVTIQCATIGNRVIIHSGTVVGGDAFYYKKWTQPIPKYEKFKSYGNVVIEEDVEIGSSCSIDRGVTASTIIGAGTKLDNQVMVGHGVHIGKNCLLAAQVGIAGKTTLEDDVILWGQVGVSKNLVLGRGCVVLAKSGVSKNLESGKTYFGIPAEEARAKWKEMAMARRK